MDLVDGLGEATRLFEVRFAGFHPDEAAMGRIGDGAGDAGLYAVADLVEALRRAAFIIVDEGSVALVDVGGQELGGFRVCAGVDQRAAAQDVGGKAGGVQVGDVGGGRATAV